MTFFYGDNINQRYWTFEYALCYLTAPFFGGFIGGHIFNQIKRAIQEQESYGNEAKDVTSGKEIEMQRTARA